VQVDPGLPIYATFERIKLSMDKTPSYVFAKYADRFFFTFKMGCGLDGGEWTIYSAIIAHDFPEAIVCQHEPAAR
jgi:hypothetical protein